LLNKAGRRVAADVVVQRFDNWPTVVYDVQSKLGNFGFDPRRVEQLYSIRGCDVVDRIPVTPRVRANLFEYSVDALVALASQNGLIDERSVLCNCFAMLAGGVAALAHDPEAQENYCGTLTRIVGDLFRKDLVKVTVATDLLALATPVDWKVTQRSLLEGSLETLSLFCDETGVRLPICEVVSAVPGGDRARAAKIYAASTGTARTAAFMVTGAREVAGRSRCRCPPFFWCSLTYVGLIVYQNNFGFLVAASVLTRHTKTDTLLTTEEMFEHVVHAFIPDSGGILNLEVLYDAGGSLQENKIRDMAVTAYCYGESWCNALDGAGTCSSSVRDQAAVWYGLARSLEDVTPQNKEDAEERILAEPTCAFMVEALPVGHAAAMKVLGLTVSKGCGVGKGRGQAVVWRRRGAVKWSEPFESCRLAAVAMGLCELTDESGCMAVKVVGALARKVEYQGQLYKDVAAKFEVKKVYDEEEAFVVPERGSEPVRRAVVAWKGAVQELSGRGSSGGRGQTHQYGRGDTPTAADFAAGFVNPPVPGAGRGRGRGRGRGNGDGQPPPPPPPGPAPAPAPGPKKKKRKKKGRYCG